MKTARTYFWLLLVLNSVLAGYLLLSIPAVFITPIDGAALHDDLQREQVSESVRGMIEVQIVHLTASAEGAVILLYIALGGFALTAFIAAVALWRVRPKLMSEKPRSAS